MGKWLHPQLVVAPTSIMAIQMQLWGGAYEK